MIFRQSQRRRRGRKTGQRSTFVTAARSSVKVTLTALTFDWAATPRRTFSQATRLELTSILSCCRHHAAAFLPGLATCEKA